MMRVLRAALWPSRSTRRVALLGIGVVTAVIAGILAMHSLSLEDDQTGAVVPAASDISTTGLIAAVSPVNPVDVAPGCDTVACGPTHAAGAITCILALLLTLSLLVLLDRSRWDAFLALLRRRLPAVSAHQGVAALAGPSLVALSISRT